MKGWYKALEDSVWLTQLGLNMPPLVMCLGGAWWRWNSWSWPEWVFPLTILLGIFAWGAELRWLHVRSTWTVTPKGKTEAVGSNHISKHHEVLMKLQLNPKGADAYREPLPSGTSDKAFHD